MRTLLVDNYDSYTFNLFQLLAAVNGTDPVVVANDNPGLATMPLDDFGNIVISPGPGHPRVPRDLGQLPTLLGRTALPVLGICLGHQALAYLAGARVGPAPQPRHGYLARIKHDDDELFAGIPPEFTAVRYHSFSVQEPLPRRLAATAWADDGVIMALRHRGHPRWGVQFHPESIASQFGRELLINFRDLSVTARPRRRPAPVPARSPASQGTGEPTRDGGRAGARALQLITASLPGAADAEATFMDLFAESPDCFWLDSSRAEPGLSRFSFLGDASGPFGEVLTYRLSRGTVTTRTADGERAEVGSAFDVLDRHLRERRIPDPGLPFDLTGGYVGYFGYEMKADCGASRRYDAVTPDAAWIFADRLIAVDHVGDRTYVLALHDGGRSRAAAEAWIAGTLARLQAMPEPLPPKPAAGTAPDLRRHLAREHARYLADIDECQRQLNRGESYEICLTNMVRLQFPDDDLSFYRRLRRANPAPYAALLRIGDMTIFSSSPERFLRIRPDGAIETKPIKGTAPRSADPARDAQLAATLAASAKTQAENLMIVDLLRNDLGQVCQIGTVAVDRYLAVESYATVHQLVSTISGQLRPSVSPVECARHCFPGGSMTGAPKLRTMEIIDRLENEARGVYSGTLGYFGLAGGADLSIVIRTAVRLGDDLTIGGGGAIVLGSDPEAEFDEMLLKAQAPLSGWTPAADPAARA